MRALLLAVALVACRSSERPAEPPVQTQPRDSAAPAPARSSRVTFDRRVELMSILCRLADFPEYDTTSGTPYLDSVDRYFATYTQDPAVQQLRALRAKHGIGYDAPMWFAVHLTDALELDNGAELPTLDARFTGVDVEALAAAVREFATRSKFDAFRAQHTAYYAQLEATLVGALEREQPIAWFDAVFGPAEASFVVIPSPIAGQNAFGPRATSRDGSLHLYQIIGVAAKSGVLEVDETLVWVLVHEMAHSYINPAFAEQRAALTPAATKIFALLESQMKAQAYASPAIMLEEAGVRAVVVNYMREKHGDAAGARQARLEMRRSFLWTNELAELFRQFAKGGTRDLDAFMPRVITFFEQLAQSYANGLPLTPFLGPVDAVHLRQPVWVVPEGAAYRYARQIHSKLPRTGELVVASPTTLREHLGKDLVAVGTPADNPVVAATLGGARWTLRDGEIALGTQRFTGKGLVLIACWYRRDDPAHGVAVYAAHDPADLVGINSLRHGTADWLIARKQGATFTVLASGDFPRGLDAVWMLPGEDVPSGQRR